MKSKVTEWGNSHGIRITSAMMDHLKVAPGEDIEINLTDRGLEIVKNTRTVEDVNRIAQEVLDAIIQTTAPIRQVKDPYASTDVDYLVVAINPCHPVIREVPKNTAGAYPTLSDAKEAARQVLQSAIAEAKTALSDLRQLGIKNIHYISL